MGIQGQNEGSINAAWTPQPGPQADAISATWCPELLFGGAKYGGKSDFLLGDFLQDVERYGKDWQGIIFRQELPQLEELIRRSHEIYPKTGAVFHGQKKIWSWKNGAKLKMRQIRTLADATKYQGHSYTWIGFDELGNWATDEPYRMAGIANLRWAGANVPRKRIRASANPGGTGHAWVKEYFIDANIKGYTPLLDEKTKLTRMFIPSRITDNRIGTLRDPDYAQRLKGLGSPDLVRAWLEGDWTVFAGRYYPEFANELHVIRPVQLPHHWTRFRMYDWGFADPFSHGWYAVASETFGKIQKGSLVKYREWYGAKKPGNGNGLRMINEHVARGVLDRQTPDEKFAFSSGDRAFFTKHGEPSCAETFYEAGLNYSPASDSRIEGANQLRSRLVGDELGPRIFFFETCTHTIRTLPLMQHDPKHIEEMMSGEDHAVDETRYACMSRPWQSPTPTLAAELRNPQTLDELLRDEDLDE